MWSNSNNNETNDERREPTKVAGNIGDRKACVGLQLVENELGRKMKKN